MFYAIGSSSMDQSNRMTGLCGICFPGDVAQRPAEWEMEEPSPQRAYQGEGYAAVRFGGRNDSRENRRKMNTKDTRNTTVDRGIDAPARTVIKDFQAALGAEKP